MTDIEIPFARDRNWRYRFWEILPGVVSWSALILPFVLGFFYPALTAFLILAYLLIWFIKGVSLSIRVMQGWFTMQGQLKLNWDLLVGDLESGMLEKQPSMYPRWHVWNIKRLGQRPLFCKPSEVYHAIIIATYNEGRETLEPTIKSVLASKFDMQKVIFVLAYEERGGPEVGVQARQLVKEYGPQFRHAIVVGHPDGIPGEVRGKGPNITYAARELQKYLASAKIKPEHVAVTTLDSDNRPHPWYLSALTYTFCSTEDPRYVSYQPIPLFLNNIWDAPTAMRVIASGNSFWNLMLSLRPHALRNFSSHAQSMAALIDTDYWSVRTITEDGHQFWRTYFRYDGRHEVYPIFIPIYQDAVLAKTYWRTIKAQFLQLRRWAYGANDIAYVATKGFGRKSKVPKVDMLAKFWRLLEGHISWATAALLILYAPQIPILLRGNTSFVANQLPYMAKWIETIALSGLFISLLVTLKSLPPKPERYKRHRTVLMVLQWALLPVTTIVFNTMAALYSQTRLIFGKYMENFDVTEKAVKK
jgi:cellulose synthase/poly-beta-1,6-N-acetylglucosamine synthase-like glycosyltransferase